MSDHHDSKILRLPEVIALTGISASSIRREEKAGRFPKRVRLGPGTVGWKSEAVTAGVRSREPVDPDK